MLDTIIKNGLVITQNQNREIIKANIGIKDGIISYLGDNDVTANNVIDATDYIITPAYLNGHIHFGEYYLRGYRGKLSTEEYITLGENFYKKFLYENEEIRNSSINNVLYESIQNGTLTVFGVRGWPNVQKFGVNSYLGYPIMNSAKLSHFIGDFENSFMALKKEKNVEYFLGLHSIEWLNDNALYAIAKFLRKHREIKLSLHFCETEKEVAYITEKYNLSPTQLMSKLGLLNKNTLLVHCNYLSSEDVNLIKESEASVAVCHSSNLKLKNEPCDVNILLKNGINVMIATDGPATSDSLSLLDAAKITALISDIDTQIIYDMITVNPAKYLGINTGSIQIGNMADILLYEKNSLNITYEKSVLENLVYMFNKPNKVMKSGKIIINNYKFEDQIEEKKILQEKNRIIKLIERKIDTGLQI